jgi:hypothetical protein
VQYWKSAQQRIQSEYHKEVITEVNIDQASPENINNSFWSSFWHKPSANRIREQRMVVNGRDRKASRLYFQTKDGEYMKFM